MIEQMKAIRKQLAEAAPLVHCITNPISINQCANLVLAVNARPIMAEHPLEVQEITRMASALLLNLGNITDVRLESIVRSAEEADRQGIPYVFDAVGTSCSELRRNFTFDFLKYHTPTVLKGNYSELQALYNCTYRSSGVDADASLGLEECSRVAVSLAREYHCVVLASGKTDIVTDGQKLIHVHNGTPQLASVTGTGCMLGALCACCLAGRKDDIDIGTDSDFINHVQPYADAGLSKGVGRTNNLTPAVMACSILGICGELAETPMGSGTFMVNLMDRLSTLTDDELEKYIKMEEIHLEEL